MPWRFRRSFKLFRGLKINLSKGGVSASVGGRGHSLNLGKRGIRSTVGVPGTGISYTQTVLKTPSASKSTTSHASLNLESEPPTIGSLDQSSRPRFKLPIGVLIGAGIVLLICIGITCTSAIVSVINPTPQPTFDMSVINTSAAKTAWAPVTLTAASVPLSTATCTETLTPSYTATTLPTLTSTPTTISTSAPTATNTLVPFPTAFMYPTQSSTGGGSGGGCCRYCTNSQPCGDSCIPKTDTCHKAPGCACP